MKSKLRLNILTDGVLVPMLANVVGKHNCQKEVVSLPEIDMLIFALKKDNEPDYQLRTEYGQEGSEIVSLFIFEDDVLVCVVEEIEILTLQQTENVPLQRYTINSDNEHGAWVA